MPVFPEVKPLTYFASVGIYTLSIVFRNHKGETLKKEYQDNKKQLYIFLTPWATFLFGWVVQFFI